MKIRIAIAVLKISVILQAFPSALAQDIKGDGDSEKILGMTVEAASETDKGIVVRTTGAEFVFNQRDNCIEAFQRIPVSRKVAEIRGVAMNGMRLGAKSAAECKITT